MRVRVVCVGVLCLLGRLSVMIVAFVHGTTGCDSDSAYSDDSAH